MSDPAQPHGRARRSYFYIDNIRLIAGYPLIVTGMCTAMRRGDCCTLLRESVDMEAGFITVKTSKTGETVQIPIFPLLRGVRVEALAKPSPRPPHYVFPHLESHYEVNPDHLTDRVKRVLRAAGFIDEQPEDGQPTESRGILLQKRKEGRLLAGRSLGQLFIATMGRLILGN